MGTLPFAAYQYCEAICTASAFGWYVFPPAEITLRWTGADVLFKVNGKWQPLVTYTPESVSEHWNANCPEDLLGSVPPLLTSLFVPGLVQIWSGFLVQTAPDWSLLVRPPVNLNYSNLYACYEALIETDAYGPWPLFTNIRLIATDIDIVIPTTRPLFQIQPMPRSAYLRATEEYTEKPVFASGDVEESAGMTESEWAGFRETIRPMNPLQGDHSAGQYAAKVRKRARIDRTSLLD